MNTVIHHYIYTVLRGRLTHVRIYILSIIICNTTLYNNNYSFTTHTSVNVNKLFIIQELGAKRSQTIINFLAIMTRWLTMVIIVLPYNFKSSIIITHSAQEII